MDYHSAISKNGIVTFADRWLEPENIKFSELTEIHMDKYCMFFLIFGSQLQIFRCIV